MKKIIFLLGLCLSFAFTADAISTNSIAWTLFTGSPRITNTIQVTDQYRVIDTPNIIDIPDIIDTSHIQDAFTAAKHLAKKHGSHKTLVIFDIDDTLLTADHDLGSHRWHIWQSDLVAKKDVDAIVRTHTELYALQNVLFTLGKMRPPEKVTPGGIRELQKIGIPVLALTSRGPQMRSATERELSLNGIHLENSRLHEGFPGTYLPIYGKGRAVSFQRGIYMTAGQNKGLMLKDLLERTNMEFEAIVFVDDTVKNAENVLQEYKFMKNRLKVFRYSKMDEVTIEFLNGDKTKVKRQWKLLKSTWQKIFN